MRPLEPLTDAEFEELDAFLLSDDTPDDCMDISMLDGFFAALATRPDFVKPTIWLPEVWGSKDGPTFEDITQANRIMSLIMRQYNEVVAFLREAPDQFEPNFYERTVENKTYKIVDEWCMGFVRGLKLENPEWPRWLRNSKLRELLNPFILFGTTRGWKEMKESGREAELHEEIVPMMGPTLITLYKLWRAPAQTGEVAPMPSVGRNDPCPCGSGKKYKRCCGLH